MASRWMFVEFPVTIANGESLSSEADLGPHALVGIRTPAAWTAADITFEASLTSGGTYAPLVDFTGTRIRVSNVETAAVRHIAMESVWFGSVQFIKLRSTAAGGVTAENQGAARTITVIARRHLP